MTITVGKKYSCDLQVAKRMRSLLHSDIHPSKCYISCAPDRKVQDPYTMRCIPQVHGIALDTINFAKNIITTEMNSATDNPMVLRDRNILISGGNFHGEYPAKVCFILIFVIKKILYYFKPKVNQRH